MVLLARVTSYAGADGELLPGGDWGMGTFFNEFFLQWGFLGAILVVNVAQLASQVTASIFPIAVINNHFMYWLLCLMLFIEAAGFVNACWPLAYGLEKLFGMSPDPELVSRSAEIFAAGGGQATKKAEDPERPAGVYDGVYSISNGSSWIYKKTFVST